MNLPEFPEWTRKAKALLDDSAQNLDGATLSRLNRARHAALAQRQRSGMRWWLATGVACACTLALALGVWQLRAPSNQATQSANGTLAATTLRADDVEMVDGDDSLDLYQNLEFYAWLDAQESDAHG